MSVLTLVNEIKKISLTEQQRYKIDLHFNNIVEIGSDIKAAEVVKLGSIGRDTELAINEEKGFLLSVAVLIVGHNIYKGEEIFNSILSRLKLIYIKGEKINITQNSIEIIFDDKLTIEVLVMFKTDTAEFVFNTKEKDWEPYFMYRFNEMFNNANKKTFNALSDIATIYKYIKKEVIKINFNNLAFEMMLFSSIVIEENWEKTLKATMTNFIVEFRKKAFDRKYSEIDNPVLNTKPIETMLITTTQTSFILGLNDFVGSVIANAIDNDVVFDNLQRKYDALFKLGKFYTIDV